jgi:predicted ATPase
MVEEPETGIHPGLLRKLVQLFRDMTTGAHGGLPTQVILTTHSPMLLNLVEPEEIRVVQRGDDGATTVTPFTNAPEVDKLLDYQGPGEIWVNQGEEYLTRRASAS